MTMTRLVSGIVAMLGMCIPIASAQPQNLEPLAWPGAPFHGVHGLRFDSHGLLHVGSVIGQSIFTIDVDSRVVERLVGPPEGMADDIAIAPDGTMFWTAIEDGIVYRRTPNGTVEPFLDDVKGANAISFSRDFERLFYTQVFYGDALYELDPAGRRAPRLISEDHGGLNAFEVAHDGTIYGPLVFGGRVVSVDPDTGAMATVSDEFDRPGALKLAGDGTAFVLDETHLKRVVLANGLTTPVTELPSGGDNLAVSDIGLVYVSLAAENAIVEVEPVSGAYGYLVGPYPFVSPAGLVVTDDGSTLYVGDMMGGLRRVDTQRALAAASDAVRATSGAQAPSREVSPSGAIANASGLATGTETNDDGITNIDTAIFQPTHVSLADQHLIVVGEVFGEIERIDAETGRVIDRYENFDIPHDALAAPNGDLIVAETGSGRVLRVTGPAPGQRSVIAEGLAEPNGLAWADDGVIFVTETAGGRLLRIDLSSGERDVVASGLAQPEGVAVDSRGRALVVEVEARRLVRVSDNGRPRVVVEALPIGLGNGPSLYRGVTVSRAGDIYISSDVDNTVYRVTL